MITRLSTQNLDDLKPFISDLPLPERLSHKGQNGKVMVIGGSGLFHAAALWAAEIACHMVDMVHFASTAQNNEVMVQLKTQFRGGIIVDRHEIDGYITEDDSILIGPGMVRSDATITPDETLSLDAILSCEDEGELTARLTHYVLRNHTTERFVLDAGALQMMRPEWLAGLSEAPILTPHQGEFARLSGQDITHLPLDQKAEVARAFAKKHGCVLLLKAVTDIVTDGDDVWMIEGGNAGLAKGGTGDILAGLTTSFYAKTSPTGAAILASYLLKRAADTLYSDAGYWYNNSDVISRIPAVLAWYICRK